MEDTDSEDNYAFDCIRDGLFLEELKKYSTYNSSSENELNNCKISLKDEFENELKSFYYKSISKSIKNVFFNVDSCDDLTLLDENFESKYEKLFKEIFKFSKQQASKLDRNSSSLENVKSRKRLEEYDHKIENKRLGKLLEKKNLKNQDALKNLDNNQSDYESDEEIEKNLIKSKSLNKLDSKSQSSSFSQKLYETYSKKYNTEIEKYRLKSKIIRSMYNKSMLNQEKSKKFRFFSANAKLGNRFASKGVDLLFNSRVKSKSQILNDETYNRFIMNCNSSSKILNPDFSRNELKDKLKRELKISTNQYNTNLEIFLLP